MHLSTSTLRDKMQLLPFQVGAHLVFLQDIAAIETISINYPDCRLAILSFSQGEDMPNYFDNVRCAWYELASNFSHTQCIDCGHIYEDFSLLRNTIQRLEQQNIRFVLLSPDALPTLHLAPFLQVPYPHSKTIISWVNSHIPYILNEKQNAISPFSKNNLFAQLWQINPHFQINAFGYHAYYVDKFVLAQLEKKGSELLRIGQIQSNIQSIEHLLRGTHLLSFDMASIKHSEAPQTYHPKAIGISAVNACQIVRYTALSNSLQALHLHGYFFERGITYLRDITAGVMAQMLWFVMSSTLQKSEDYPVITAHLQEHIVLCKDIDFPLSFFKNNRSDKWWFAMAEWELIAPEEHNPFLIPCSRADYIQTKEGELPERLWRFLIKTSF